MIPPTGWALLALAAPLYYLAARPAFFLLGLSVLALVLVQAVLTPAARRELGWRPVALAAGLPGAAWLLPHVWLLHGAMLVLIPLVARRRGQVAPLYLFGMFLLPGLDVTVSAGPLKLFDMGVRDALAFGAAATLLAHPRWRARVPGGIDFPALLLLAMLVAVFARGTSVTNVLRLVVNVGFDAGLPYYIVSRGVRDGDDARRCLLHLAAAAAVVSAVLLFEAWKAWPIYNVLYDRFGVPATLMVKSRGGVLRASGMFLESTSLAMVLVFCFLAAWLSRDAFRSRLHQGALLALLLAGLVPPQSRGAWMGVFAGMALADLYRGRLRDTALRLGVVGVAGLALVVVARGRPQLAETLGLGGGAAETVDYREQLLARGLEELRDRPLFGFSLADLQMRLADMVQGEGIIDFVNTHLYFALIGGAVGLAIFDGAFLFYLGRLWRDRRRWRRRGAAELRVAGFAFASMGTAMLMLAFTSFTSPAEGFLLGMFGLAAALTRNAVKGRGRSGQRPATNGSSIALAASPAATPTAAAAKVSASSPGFSSPARCSAHQL